MLKLRLEVVKHIFNVTQLASGWAWIWTQVSEWKLCPTLCDLMDCSLPSSSVYGILQARILEWVAIPFSRGSSQLKNRTQVSRIAGGFFTSWAAREVFPIPKPGVLSTALCSQGLALLLVCMHWCRKTTMSLWNQLPPCVSHLLQITGLFLIVSPWCKVLCEWDLHGILSLQRWWGL